MKQEEEGMSKMGNVLMVARSKLTPRMLVMAAVLALAAFGLAEPEDPDYILTSESFADLATQILTYLGYAVVAGLTVLVAVIGARRAWSFMRRFL